MSHELHLADNSQSSNASNSTPVESAATGGRFLAAYQRVSTLVAAVTDEELTPFNLDVPHAVAVVLRVWPKLLSLRPRLARLAETDIEEFDRLLDLTLALAHTHAVVQSVSTPPSALPELHAKALVLRDSLFYWSKGLATEGLLDGSGLGEIEKGSGYRDTVFDLLALNVLLRGAWSEIDGKSPITMERLDAAVDCAERLTFAIGERDGAKDRAPSAMEARHRTFTLFDRAYDQTRRAVHYLRWKDGDANEYAPSLYDRTDSRGKSRAQSGAEREPEEGEPATGDSDRKDAASRYDGIPRELMGDPSRKVPQSDPFLPEK